MFGTMMVLPDPFEGEAIPIANRGSGEADSSGSPSPQRDENEAWPTLIIEAGDSSTLEDLRRDVRCWFSASDHRSRLCSWLSWIKEIWKPIHLFN